MKRARSVMWTRRIRIKKRENTSRITCVYPKVQYLSTEKKKKQNKPTKCTVSRYYVNCELSNLKPFNSLRIYEARI